MNFLRARQLTPAASDLVQFDTASIRQAVAALHLAVPDVWLADPDAYENNGRILRDSESARMLAYSRKDRVLYATDGCNSCTRRLRTSLETLTPAELVKFAQENEVRLELLEELVRILL
jgi:hypothetical protein